MVFKILSNNVLRRKPAKNTPNKYSARPVLVLQGILNANGTLIDVEILHVQMQQIKLNVVSMEQIAYLMEPIV